MAANDMILGYEGYEAKTLIFKVVDGLELSLDILYPSKPSSKPTPVLIHYHGGFLVIGFLFNRLIPFVSNMCYT